MFVTNMNKKTLIATIVGILVLALIGIGFYFYFKNGSINPFSDGTGGFNNPGGNNVNTPRPQTGSTSNNDTVVVANSNFQTEARLVKISEVPVSGFTVYDVGSSTLIRYIDRATGNLFEVNTTKSQKNRISNTTIPKVEDIAWGSRGSSFVMRYAKDGVVQGLYAVVSSTTATSTSVGALSELTSTALPVGIVSYVYAPKKDQAVFATTESGTIKVSTMNTKTRVSSPVWTFPTTEWLLSWPADTVISANTKASNGVAGYLLEINPVTKKVMTVLSGVPGLTTLMNNKTKWVLFSESDENGTKLKVYDPQNLTKQEIVPTTLPEKCVWTNTSVRLLCAVPKSLIGTLPDDWYQGVTTFSDSMWLYDPNAGWATEVSADLEKESGTQIDVINPELSPKDTLLVFMNKKDLSLWALKIDPKQAFDPGGVITTATTTQP